MNQADHQSSKDALSLAQERVLLHSSPEAVRALPPEQIPSFCEDLRRVLIDRVERNGGHLASNLGVVELTVAIHRVFHAPVDHIIFDVGHQCYVHKLLTGRAESFETLRRAGGLSGFPKREESEYDAFGTGHASTSLSAALGFAQADRLKGSQAYTVVVLGDGALTGGMIHEALNNCQKDLRLIVILNENEMSISKNVGHFASLLTRLRTASSYSQTKAAVEKMLQSIPLLGAPMHRATAAVKNAVKNLLYSSNYFESMGLNYYGASDGNDEAQVEHLLRTAKAKESCCLVHLRTVKGKGYDCAERSPDAYHGVAPAASDVKQSPTFSQIFGQTLTRLAEQNKDICAITAAMPQGTGLCPFSSAHPERFFDVGIAEEHAVTFAAGLAAQGMRPVVALYSTFLQRAYDQILHDVALQKLPVLFAIDRAGLNASDGPTHHGVFDVSFLCQIPGVEIWEPATTDSLARILTGLLETDRAFPAAVRYSAGRDHAGILRYVRKATPWFEGALVDFDVSKPPRALIVTYGRITASVLEAVSLAKESVGVVLLEHLTAFEALTSHLADACEKGLEGIVFCEEGVRNGGVGMISSSLLCEKMQGKPLPAICHLALNDGFVETVPNKTVWQAAGLGVEHILDAINQVINE